MQEKMKNNLFEDSAETVAKELLGKYLCRKLPSGDIIRLRIMETEAYPAEDTACYGYGYEGNHGDKPKTPANAPLFEAGGTCCIYGGMILIVCGKTGQPDNVLIRAAVGEEEYYDGPCKVADALQVDKKFHGMDLTNRSELWIEENPDHKNYIELKRKGLGKTATEEDKMRKLRFIVAVL